MTIPGKIDTSFNLQSFLQALILAGGVIAWAMSVEARFASSSAAQAADRAAFQAFQAATARSNERLEDKIDKLIDLHVKRGD